nr:zinc finger BED domain-containing protein 1-like [Paramormyrops kingsleyae]
MMTDSEHKQSTEDDCSDITTFSTMWSEKRHDNDEVEEEDENQQPPRKHPRKSPLEELFADDDAEKRSSQRRTMSIQDHAEKEMQMYKETPPTFTSDDPAAWWWNQRMTYPLMSNIAFSYLCVQASSTPSERVFSTAGDTICAERSRIQPEKADMLIFLNKNCF